MDQTQDNNDQKEQEDADLSSSSSSSEDEDEEKLGMTLMEIRAKKIKRNQNYLQELGLLKPKHIIQRKNLNKEDENENEKGFETAPKRGVLLPPILPGSSQSTLFADASVREPATPCSRNEMNSYAANVKQLNLQFPGRHRQIEQLASLLLVPPTTPSCAAVGTTAGNGTPIVVLGPAGTGKSSLVQSICEIDMHQTCPNKKPTIYTYINLTTSKDSWIQQIESSVTQQLFLEGSYGSVEDQPSLPKTKKRKRTKNEESAPRRRSQRSATVDNNYNNKKNGTSKATTKDMIQEQHASAASSTGSQPMVVHGLGRFLQEALRDNTYDGRRMVLVLDQVERLLEGAKQSSSPLQPNFLAQLLLLHRTLPGLQNLTIVAIANSLLVTRMRLNRMLDPSRSLASLLGNIQPIQVYFPAYTGAQMFETIFHTPRIALLVTGESHWIGDHDQTESDESNSFQRRVYKSFVHAFINTLYDSCQGMNELIRMGRLLWPIYIQPLSDPTVLEQTLDSVATTTNISAGLLLAGNDQSSKFEGSLLEYINRRALSRFRHVIVTCSSSVACPPQLTVSKAKNSSRKEHSLDNLARPARYLLLAAYLCQVNRPEKDRSLFSIQKNGRPSRKKSLGEKDVSNNEKSFRLRSFPLERMLSIFVSLMALHEVAPNGNYQKQDEQEDQVGRLQERAGEWLSLLVSLGVIQSSSWQDFRIRLSEPRYTCHVMLDQAQSVATSLDFPLDRYVLS